MSLQRILLEDLTGLLRHRRRELGLTQKQMGQMLGIDQRTVSSLEKNPGSISVKRLFVVMEALQVGVFVSTDARDAQAIPSRSSALDSMYKNSRAA